MGLGNEAQSRPDKKPYKRYVDEIISQGRPLSDVWDDIQFLRGNHPERV